MARSDQNFQFSQRPVPTHCEELDCHGVTRSGKPYCPSHVGKNDYVILLEAEVKARFAEVRKAAEGGSSAVNPHGSIATEIVELLQERGPLTVPRVSREMSFSHEAAKAFVAALIQAQLVKDRGLNSRGTWVVEAA